MELDYVSESEMYEVKESLHVRADAKLSLVVPEINAVSPRTKLPSAMPAFLAQLLASRRCGVLVVSSTATCGWHAAASSSCLSPNIRGLSCGTARSTSSLLLSAIGLKPTDRTWHYEQWLLLEFVGRERKEVRILFWRKVPASRLAYALKPGCDPVLHGLVKDGGLSLPVRARCLSVAFRVRDVSGHIQGAQTASPEQPLFLSCHGDMSISSDRHPRIRAADVRRSSDQFLLVLWWHYHRPDDNAFCHLCYFFSTDLLWHRLHCAVRKNRHPARLWKSEPVKQPTGYDVEHVSAIHKKVYRDEVYRRNVRDKLRMKIDVQTVVVKDTLSMTKLAERLKGWLLVEVDALPPKDVVDRHLRINDAAEEMYRRACPVYNTQERYAARFCVVQLNTS